MDGKISKISEKIISKNKDKFTEIMKGDRLYGEVFEVDGVKYKLTDGTDEKLDSEIEKLLNES